MNTWVALLIPFLLQGLLMVVDEFHYHEKRGLGLWERVGHPLDTLTVLITLGFALVSQPDVESNRVIYITLSALSCVFVTKDEWVHTRESSAGENALHALLFLLHPAIFWSGFQLWHIPEFKTSLQLQFAIILLFGLYQVIRWRPWNVRDSFLKKNMRPPSLINTEIYSTLGERWYTAKDDPIALLRAENRARLPWVSRELEKLNSKEGRRLLDLGCGAGFLANSLATRLDPHFWSIEGLDASGPALEVAKSQAVRAAESCPVSYTQGDARKLPFEDASFDAVCAMDFLEHVEDPAQILAEVSRVLKPGGLFFFHTFTRSALSRFLVIDLVEAFIPNTPPGLHVESLFIQPEELKHLCATHQLRPEGLQALNPVITPAAIASLLFKGEIPDSFQFKIEKESKIRAGYIGQALKI